MLLIAAVGMELCYLRSRIVLGLMLLLRQLPGRRKGGAPLLLELLLLPLLLMLLLQDLVAAAAVTIVCHDALLNTTDPTCRGMRSKWAHQAAGGAKKELPPSAKLNSASGSPVSIWKRSDRERRR